MFEKANTDLVLSMYEAFGRGDVQFILDNVTDDVDWITEGPSLIPYAGHLKGKAAVLGFFQAIGSTQDNPRLTTDHVVAQGDGVATFGRYSFTAKATGKYVDTAIGHYFQIKDGKVSRFLDFCDTAALAAAYTMTATA
jgi:ketosteroid isomerase-like protein